VTDSIGWSVLFTRPLWTDEISLTFLANERSLTRMLADLARGGDWAPPLLHLVLWTLTRLFGTLGPVALRAFALLCVVGALGFTYAILRRRLDPWSSAAGVLAVAGHTLVIAHAFEARFYAPWLLCSAGFAWSLGRRRAAVAAFSILVCTIHWFGIASLGLMCAAALASYGRRWREGVRVIAPSVAGLLAFLGCLPLLFAQLSASTGTWVPPLNIDQIGEMTRSFWLSAVPLAAAIVLLATLLRARAPGGAAPQRVPVHPSIAALFGLALMPVFLMFVSVVLQPSMVTRYGVVAALAWAPLVSLAVAALPWRLRMASVAVLAVVMVAHLADSVRERREYRARVQAFRDEYDRTRPFAMKVVFTSVHTIYPVVGPQHDRAPWARYLDVPDSVLGRMYPTAELAWLRNYFRVERDIGRSQARMFGFPRIATRAELDTTRQFLLLATEASLPRGYKSVFVYGMVLFPHHRVRRLSETLTLFER
jgi:hypothetical protein